MDINTLYVLIFTIFSLSIYVFNILSGITIMRKPCSYINILYFALISFTSFISSVFFFKNFTHYMLTCNYVYSLYENYSNLSENLLISIFILILHIFILLKINKEVIDEIKNKISENNKFDN